MAYEEGQWGWDTRKATFNHFKGRRQAGFALYEDDFFLDDANNLTKEWASLWNHPWEYLCRIGEDIPSGTIIQKKKKT